MKVSNTIQKSKDNNYRMTAIINIENKNKDIILTYDNENSYWLDENGTPWTDVETFVKELIKKESKPKINIKFNMEIKDEIIER